MICAVLYAESFSLLDQQLQAALNQGSEIIEIRLDAISNLNVEHLSNLIKTSIKMFDKANENSDLTKKSKNILSNSLYLNK